MVANLTVVVGPIAGSDPHGGLSKPFINRSKRFIDQLNAEHTRGKIAPTMMTRETLSIGFYNGIVVFEKAASSQLTLTVSHELLSICGTPSQREAATGAALAGPNS